MGPVAAEDNWNWNRLLRLSASLLAGERGSDESCRTGAIYSWLIKSVWEPYVYMILLKQGRLVWTPDLYLDIGLGPKSKE